MNKILNQDKYGNWEITPCKKNDLIFPLTDDAELLITDWQLGHESVSDNTLRNLTKWMKKEPHRYAVTQDFLDDGWLSKYNRLSYGSDTQSEELKRVENQIGILKPVFDRFLFQIGSNHWVRRFGLELPASQSQRARTQFNEIYGIIYDENPNFKQFMSTECIIKHTFETHPSIELAYIHPSRLGSANTAMARLPSYFGYYGVVVGHVHSNIRKEIQSRKGDKLRVWFASHLFYEQPEYEKERMAIEEPSKPLVLGWKEDTLTGTEEFMCL